MNTSIRKKITLRVSMMMEMLLNCSWVGSIHTVDLLRKGATLMPGRMGIEQGFVTHREKDGISSFCIPFTPLLYS